MVSSNAGAEGGKRHTIQRTRVHAEVQACLLNDIRSGVYVEGQKLPSERELMDIFGVGRPAVREALAGLERIGLLEISPGMRARVCKLRLKPMLGELRSTLEIYASSNEGWRQIHDLRLFFEASVVRQIASHISDTQLAKLRHILEEQHLCMEQSKLFAFVESDVAFHHAMVDCLGNPFLSMLAEGFKDWLIPSMYASMQVCSQIERSYRAHMVVFHALEKRDAALAEQSIRHHLEEMRTFYQRDLSQMDKKAEGV